MRRGLLWVVLVLTAAACDLRPEREPVMPEPAAAAERYAANAAAEVRGNLLEVRITMAEELMAGGPIWARSGPFFYLFSPATRELFEEFPDLAAVRVVTVTPAGEEVARADLHRDALTETRWREALGRSALAQRDGTERPSTLLALTRFGEDHTEFAYNPRFAGE